MLGGAKRRIRGRVITRGRQRRKKEGKKKICTTNRAIKMSFQARCWGREIAVRERGREPYGAWWAIRKPGAHAGPERSVGQEGPVGRTT